MEMPYLSNNLPGFIFSCKFRLIRSPNMLKYENYFSASEELLQFILIRILIIILCFR